MKKTLIAMMALAGVALADTPTPVLTLTNNSSLITLPDSVTSAFTMGLTLDVDTVKSHLLADSGSNQQLINIGTGSAINIGSRIGLAVCYNGENSAIQGTWNEALSSTQVPNGFQVGMGMGSFDNLKWNDAAYASLVMTYTYASGATNGVTAIFTLADASGNILNQIGGTYASGLKAQTYDAACMQLGSAVEYACVYNSCFTTDEAKALGTKLVPEPTTATLSLLALAGLAARRRRH